MVESTGFENQQTRKSLESSNLSLSAGVGARFVEAQIQLL